ncbi:helix-turn-helix domain-containing protein [Streptomyces sp. NPDC088258]|uniref:helix-turn-helix domain-containing protein n=1 Tax=Streptomyces sp. NPDC088258 TaxID=3365849 RepID=UPI0037F5DD20
MHQTPTTFEVDGAAICTKRMQAGFEVTELAAVVGITASYLRKLERGARKHMRPGPYTRLRAALNATDDELLAPHRDTHTERK